MSNEEFANVYDLVGSRRFCFVIMPGGKLDLLYDHLRQVIEGAAGLPCIRADKVAGLGHPVLAKVHALIEKAELVVAELSEPNPNVYYEVGYAKALRKEILVICKADTEIPADLKGVDRLEYTDLAWYRKQQS